MNSKINYKVIIMLFVLMFLVFMVYREVTKLQKTVEESLTLIHKQVKETNDNTIDNVQNKLSQCVNKIKELSNNNIHEVRRIMFINRQPIMKESIPNSFRETEGSDASSHIEYLSETNQNNNTDNNQSNDKDLYFSPITEDDKVSVNLTNIQNDDENDDEFEYVYEYKTNQELQNYNNDEYIIITNQQEQIPIANIPIILSNAILDKETTDNDDIQIDYLDDIVDAMNNSSNTSDNINNSSSINELSNVSRESNNTVIINEIQEPFTEEQLQELQETQVKETQETEPQEQETQVEEPQVEETKVDEKEIDLQYINFDDIPISININSIIRKKGNELNIYDSD